ncbi:MAG: hypothetical protein WA655_01790 [Candidatus Korobacteraceae bacterium]
MDYYQNVVIDYLRADRAVFVNTECCVQTNQAHNPDSSGPHWYCDAVAADFRSKVIFLCEISYSVQLADLTKRLKDWHKNWDEVRHALARENFLPDWPVRVWLFVPEHLTPLLLERLDRIGNGQPLKLAPRITPLEMVQPWHYCSWDRIGEIACCAKHACAKPTSIPEAMAK